MLITGTESIGESRLRNRVLGHTENITPILTIETPKLFYPFGQSSWLHSDLTHLDITIKILRNSTWVQYLIKEINIKISNVINATPTLLPLERDTANKSPVNSQGKACQLEPLP